MSIIKNIPQDKPTFQFSRLREIDPAANLLAGSVLEAMINNSEWCPASAAQRDNIFGLVSSLFCIHLQIATSSLNDARAHAPMFIERTLMIDVSDRIQATHSFIADLKLFPKYEAAVAVSTEPLTLRGVGGIFKLVTGNSDPDELKQIDVLYQIFDCFISMDILGAQTCCNIVHALKHVTITQEVCASLDCI